MRQLASRRHQFLGHFFKLSDLFRAHFAGAFNPGPTGAGSHDPPRANNVRYCVDDASGKIRPLAFAFLPCLDQAADLLLRKSVYHPAGIGTDKRSDSNALCTRCSAFSSLSECRIPCCLQWTTAELQVSARTGDSVAIVIRIEQQRGLSFSIPLTRKKKKALWCSETQS